MSGRGGAWALAVIGLAVLAAGRSAADQTTPLPDSKSRPDSIVFAGIPWLTPVDRVAAELAAHGFAETRSARSKDRLAASGRLFDRYAVVHAGLDDQGRLVRWEILLTSKGERDEYAIQRKIYDDAVTEMLAKYGRRQQAVEAFRFPYTKGDGNEARGIRQGYVTIRSAWSSRGRDRLSVGIADDMSVALTYESRAWKKVEAERRKKKAKDF
jgi:hypothetical protein